MPYINPEDKRFNSVVLLPDRGFDDRDGNDIQNIQNKSRKEHIKNSVGNGVVSGMEVIKGAAGWNMILNPGTAFVGGEAIVVPLVDTTLTLGENSFTEDEIWYVIIRNQEIDFIPRAPGEPGFYKDVGDLTSYRKENNYKIEIVNTLPTYNENFPYLVLSRIDRFSTASDIGDSGVVLSDKRQFLKKLDELTESFGVLRQEFDLQKRLILLQTENYDNVVFDDFVDQSQMTDDTTIFYDEKLEEVKLNSSGNLFNLTEEILVTTYFTPQLPVSEAFYLPEQMDDPGNSYEYVKELGGQKVLVTNYPVQQVDSFEVRNEGGEIINVGNVSYYEHDPSKKSVVFSNPNAITSGNYTISHFKVANIEALKIIVSEGETENTIIKKEFSFDGNTFFPFSLVDETTLDDPIYDSYDKTKIMFRFKFSTKDQLETPVLRDWAVYIRMEDLPS